MRAILQPAKLGGLLAGMFGTLAIGLLAGVLYSGQGLGDDGVPPPQIYTDF